MPAGLATRIGVAQMCIASLHESCTARVRFVSARMGDSSHAQTSRASHAEPLLEQVKQFCGRLCTASCELNRVLSHAAVQGGRVLDEGLSAQDNSQTPAVSNLTGMVLYASSSLSLTAMLSCAHELTRRHGVPVFEVIFVREMLITALAGLAAGIGQLTQPAAKYPFRTHRYGLTR